LMKPINGLEIKWKCKFKNNLVNEQVNRTNFIRASIVITIGYLEIIN